MSIAVKVILAVFAFSVLIGGLGYVAGWFGEAAKVVQDEFGPKAMLEKYEWFKDAAANLEKKQADVAVYEGRIKAMDETYKELPRQKWPREDREQYNVWVSEVAGVKASYNQLAADYNAQMAKFNWAFANVGELPKGADRPLPREFKPYETK
ncbi:MAG: hypothetical protein A2934_04185 [Candidatus Sungbacteria bacterium RIFCSPLOWO2_01_FULL_47_10]|uniref:Uncharacterized protein n=1 Tax=Candidatus Sungbacteria bacterium RIFCSPLOWO2_01_FULL_47_10 TaxID=1802276 RepID=A0A1G2L1I3_9BACT|nr:MAG: hypothetical protein A2934_04185 [Candidatus Sungbacteria bacterium RIFCSPLOWO2_01_FULL_47_10]